MKEVFNKIYAKPAGRLSPANWRGKQDVRLSDKSGQTGFTHYLRSRWV